MDVAPETGVEIEGATESTAFERIFVEHYARIVSLLARLTRDPARSEELAVEVFLKLSKQRWKRMDNLAGWLSKTAARAGLDELRRGERMRRLDKYFRWGRPVSNPEEAAAANQEANRVRKVLQGIGRRDAEILVLRNEGMNYEEISMALGLHAASIGTFAARAQKAFQKEYRKRYGNTATGKS